MSTVIKVFDRGVIVGDALFLDNNSPKRKVFLRYSELDSVPSGYTFVGVVFNVKNNVAKILNKTAVNTKYALLGYSDGMATSSEYKKKTGAVTNYRGIMNVARGVAYWATNGRTPTANVPIVEDGNNNPVSRASFESDTYCTTLRSTYANYESYIKENYGVMYPQNYGCFNLPDSKTLQATYATQMDGSNPKYPAFYHCYNINYNSDGLNTGQWFLPNVWDGCELMRDDVLAKVAATMTKLGGSVPNNSTYRWFAQRYGTSHAWFFSGNGGVLDGYAVTDEFCVQAVTLLTV